MEKLNLGCGLKKIYGYTNIDNRKEMEPDLLWNVCNGLPYDDNSIEEIKAFDFMEHIPQNKVIFVMQEIYRALCKGGIFHFLIPSVEGLGAWMDPYHVSFWSRNNFLYYCEPAWHELYPELPLFSILEMENVIFSKELKIIHIHGKITPVKD